MYIRKPRMDDEHGEERYDQAKLDVPETSIPINGELSVELPFPNDFKGTYVSRGQMIPSSSRSKNATCLCSAVSSFSDAKPLFGAVLGPSLGTTMFKVLGSKPRKYL